MICGKKSTEPYTDARWWFAWRPVMLGDGRWAWGQRVWRWWEPRGFHVGAAYRHSLSIEDAVAYYRGLIERSGFYTVGPGARGPSYAKPIECGIRAQMGPKLVKFPAISGGPAPRVNLYLASLRLTKAPADEEM